MDFFLLHFNKINFVIVLSFFDPKFEENKEEGNVLIIPFCSSCRYIFNKEIKQPAFLVIRTNELINVC